MRINTNIASLQAQNALQRTTKALQRSMERLASGKRINSAKDDAAGLGIVEGLTSQIRGLSMGVKNINQAFGYLQTADGVLESQAELLQRMKELAVQASNGTLSSRDRDNLDTELQKLLEEFNRLTNQASFNGSRLIDGSMGTLSLQVGAKAGQTIEFGMPSIGAFTSATTTVIGNGFGTFATAKTSSLAGSHDLDAGTDFKVVDLNNDGYLDVYSYIPSKTEVAISFNNGNGTFSAAKTFQNVASNEMQPKIEDLNGDGKMDVWFSTSTGGDNNAGSATVFYQGSGNSFSGQKIYFSGAGGPTTAVDVQMADVNGDGRKDIVAGFANGRLETYMQLSDGKFGNAQNLGTTSYTAGSMHLADFNRDGRADLIWQKGGVWTGVQGQSDGTFVGSKSFDDDGVGSDWTPLIQDLDGNGSSDLVFVDSTAKNLFGYDGDYNLMSQNNIEYGAGDPSNLHLTDFNGDGLKDIYMMASDGFTTLLNAGEGQFTIVQTGKYDGSSGAAENVAFKDLNGDGIMDYYRYYNSGDGRSEIYIYYGYGDGTFAEPTTLATMQDYEIQSVQDFDGDGTVDFFVSTPHHPGSFAISYGNSPDYSNVTSVDTGWNFSQFQFGDINGDGLIDALGFDSQGAVDPFLGRAGAAGFDEQTKVDIAGNTNGIELKDVNGDGILDLFSYNSIASQNKGGVNLGNGFGGFAPVVDFSLPLQYTTRPYLYDLNNDGSLDLLSMNSSPNNFMVALQNVDSTTTTQTLSVKTQALAQDMLAIIDNEMKVIVGARAKIGATMNRLESAANSSSITIENLSSARSGVLDADIASESADLIRNQILQQAGASVLAQANLNLQLVLSLLR